MKRVAGVAAATALAAVACSARPSAFVAPVPLRAAPEPAVSPPATPAPAGRLIAVGPGPEGVVATAGGVLAVSIRGPQPGLDLRDARGEPVGPGFVTLPGEARHLDLAAPDGPVLVPVETADRLVVVDLPAGAVAGSYPVGHQPHDAAAIPGGYAVGDEFGNSVHVVGPGRAATVAAAPLQPGGVAASGGNFVVVGVRARVIAAYRSDGRLLAEAGAGAGPTHVVAGPAGTWYVADTTGNALLVYSLTGTRLRQTGRIPVGARPYGLAFDPSTGWVYVTLTGTDQLLGMRLAGARPVERRIWDTGRQPNSVAVDEHDHLLAVTLTATDQLEMIAAPGS